VNPVLRRSAAHVFVTDLDVPALDESDEHHLRRVLRIRPDDVVTISDGVGRWTTARLTAAGLEPDGDIATEAQPAPVEVWSAIPKGDRPEWIVQKLTELGVARIGFVHCARSVVRWDAARAERQMDRLRRVAREAAMQSRRVWLPEMVGPLALTDLDPTALAFADPEGAPLAAPVRRVVIGPEGGFTADELAAAPAVVSVGALVLRVETAAVAAAVLLTAPR
jgi:16S rRNA (uracil1498-N3)-methyltransferase